jgi:hypothetical protein
MLPVEVESLQSLCYLTSFHGVKIWRYRRSQPRVRVSTMLFLLIVGNYINCALEIISSDINFLECEDQPRSKFEWRITQKAYHMQHAVFKILVVSYFIK